MSEVCNMGDEIGGDFLCEVLREQQNFFETGGTRLLGERMKVLHGLLEGLGAREDDILEALSVDLGKPGLEGWLAEVYFLKAELKLVMKNLGKWMKPRRVGSPFFVMPARSEVRREPFGRVLVMGPWNYPLQLALSPVIGAVAAGNCVVLKPSEVTPETSRVLRELVEDVVGKEWVWVVEGGAEVGAALLRESFDFYFYTGGERVGRLVGEAAAREMVPCVLELGGKCPVIVDEEVDLSVVAKRVVVGKFFNAGQTCVAPDFVMVKDRLKVSFLDEIKKVVRESYGDGLDDLARLPNEGHWKRVMKLLPEDVEQLGNDDRAGLKMAPRWGAVSWEDAVMKEEVFGPFLPIVGYRDEDELWERLGGLNDPLAVYVFSKRAKFVDDVMSRVRSGSVCVNDVMKQAVNQRLPFGGVGKSGFGRYRGRASFEAFTYERGVMRRGFSLDPFAAKPPYGTMLERLRKLM